MPLFRCSITSTSAFEPKTLNLKTSIQTYHVFTSNLKLYHRCLNKCVAPVAPCLAPLLQLLAVAPCGRPFNTTQAKDQNESDKCVNSDQKKIECLTEIVNQRLRLARRRKNSSGLSVIKLFSLLLTQKRKSFVRANLV